MRPESRPLPLPSAIGGRVFSDDGYLDAFPLAHQQQSGTSARGAGGRRRKGGAPQVSSRRAPGAVTVEEATLAGSGHSRPHSILSDPLIRCVYCPRAGPGHRDREGRGKKARLRGKGHKSQVSELSAVCTGGKGGQVFHGKLSSARVQGDSDDFNPRGGVGVADKKRVSPRNGVCKQSGPRAGQTTCWAGKSSPATAGTMGWRTMLVTA